MKWVLNLVGFQFLLGVSTILLILECKSRSVIHQLVALFLFAALLGLVHSLSGNTIGNATDPNSALRGFT